MHTCYHTYCFIIICSLSLHVGWYIIKPSYEGEKEERKVG